MIITDKKFKELQRKIHIEIETKIEMKNLCPMIVMISSSISKVIFDIVFVETITGVGT